MKQADLAITTPTTTELQQLIDDARAAEQRRDIGGMRNILDRVWPSVETDPDFSSYPPAERGELLRLTGFLLTFYGKARTQANWQLRAKDVITRAIEIFRSCDMADKAAESQVNLAFAYWNSGEISEAEALLDQLTMEFETNSTAPAYLHICVNRLMIMCWTSDVGNAVRLIEHLESVDLTRDTRLLMQFNLQAGIIYQLATRYDLSVRHLTAAIDLARQIDNYHYVGLATNCLAMTHKCHGDHLDAHVRADEAIAIFRAMEDLGWLPHVLDTKGLIFLDQGRLADALASIDTAISLFRTGEDYAGLTDSLWNRCLCLLRMNRVTEALAAYGDLQHIAAMQIGNIAVEKYAKALAAEVYIPRGLPLSKEISAFKKNMVSRALTGSRGNIGAAARTLKLKSHQALSEILNNQFPELYAELGIKRRKRRGDTVGETRTSLPRELPDIRLVSLSDIRLPVNLDPSTVTTYACSRTFTWPLGLTDDAVVAVIEQDEYPAGTWVLCEYEGQLGFALVQFEKLSRLLYVELKDAYPPPPLGELRIYGTPVAFCPLDDLDRDPVTFYKLTLPENDLLT